MKKKFDVKSTLVVPSRQLTPEQIELATRQIHKPEAIPIAAQTDESAPKTMIEKPAEEPKKEKSAPQKPRLADIPKLPKLQPIERAPRREAKVLGRIGRRIVTDDPDRKVRLSIDVRPEVHKKLKMKAIEHDSDIMRYVEMLIEKDLGLL